jgi:hypothetical protein
MKFLIKSLVGFLLPVIVNGISYTVPSSAPGTAAALDPAPVGVSYATLPRTKTSSLSKLPADLNSSPFRRTSLM